MLTRKLSSRAPEGHAALSVPPKAVQAAVKFVPVLLDPEPQGFGTVLTRAVDDAVGRGPRSWLAEEPYVPGQGGRLAGPNTGRRAFCLFITKRFVRVGAIVATEQLFPEIGAFDRASRLSEPDAPEVIKGKAAKLDSPQSIPCDLQGTEIERLF